MRLKNVIYLAGSAVAVLMIALITLSSPPPQLLVTADLRPYAYRALTWWVFKGLVGLGSSPTLAVIMITTTSLVGFMAALEWLGNGVGFRLKPAHIGLIVMGLPIFMLGGTHLYDLPTLALFTVSLAAIAHRRWRTYAILFVLASLNRETTFLLGVVYAFYVGWNYGLLAQAIAFIIVQAGLRLALADLPGVAFEVHWDLHFLWLADRWKELMVYAVLAIVILCLAIHQFRAKPRLLRISALVVTPALVAVYFGVGYPFEFRVFLEAYPALALLALFNPNLTIKPPQQPIQI